MPALSHQKEQVVPHVFIDSSDFCSEVDDMSRAVFLKHSFGLPAISVHICLKLVVKIVKAYMLEKEPPQPKRKFPLGSI